MKRIIDQLQKSHTILLASHSSPDGDAIGSLLAAGLALKAMGKDARMFNESPIPAVYRFLPWINAIQQTIDMDIHYDTAVILDCGVIHRVGTAAQHIRKMPMIINVDHHVTNTRFGHLQLIDTRACATAEIVYRLIEEMPVAMDSAMATAIYTGILTDTGSFRFSNTNRAAFAICSQMIEHGANPYEVAQNVFGHYSLGRIKLLNMALDSLELSDNGMLSIMTLTQCMLEETHTQTHDIDGFINYARNIEEVKVAALIHELRCDANAHKGDRNDYHVSLRSDGAVDVAHIAANYGGGGHASAAGFTVNTTLAELKAQIIKISESIPRLCEVN